MAVVPKKKKKGSKKKSSTSKRSSGSLPEYPKNEGSSKTAKVGDVITRVTKKGRLIKMQRVKAHGKNKKLKWRILSNKPVKPLPKNKNKKK